MGHIWLQTSFQVPTKPNALKVKFLWPLFPYLDKGGNNAKLKDAGGREAMKNLHKVSST